MAEDHRTIFLRHARPLEPIPTGERPTRCTLERIRAVLFDVYGTLLITAADEVAAQRGAKADACRAALIASGVSEALDGQMGVDCLACIVDEHQHELRKHGNEYPEVDIVKVWRYTLDDLIRRKHLPAAARNLDAARVAVEYEARVNPVWPMPHARKCIESLCSSGALLGLISNAQFYTQVVLEALLGDSLEDLGFDPDLQYYSFRHGHAKPGVYIYERARHALAQRGVLPGEVLYVGNDMLNDIRPAKQIGFRAALFAGDRRSFYPRKDDPNVSDVAPDIVITDLLEIMDRVSLRGENRES